MILVPRFLNLFTTLSTGNIAVFTVVGKQLPADEGCRQIDHSYTRAFLHQYIVLSSSNAPTAGGPS